jgi:hypothetical protein
VLSLPPLPEKYHHAEQGDGDVYSAEMNKPRLLLPFLLTLALLLQSFGYVHASGDDCCADDCRQDMPFCQMRSMSENCQSCTTAAIFSDTLSGNYSSGLCFLKIKSIRREFSTFNNTIWRPPIFA